jgi:hypothetical protein
VTCLRRFSPLTPPQTLTVLPRFDYDHMDIPLPAEPATNWELLSRTAPDQFIAALRAGAGDAPTLVRVSVLSSCLLPECRGQDFIYSFVAVRKRESSKDIHWSRLVDAGVIDALCECVIHAKTRPLDPISRSRWRIETSVWPLRGGKILNN